jgi:mRNA interferase HigB
VRIITKQRLIVYAQRHPTAKSALEHWHNIARHARWKSLVDVRSVLPSADPIRVRSGRTVHVFNLKGNAYRLITAIHYDRQKGFILHLLPHADYSKNDWKEIL